MWDAVNKLDDQCAAGNYDGKGCSIEQAWDCLIDAAATPPAAKQRQPLTGDQLEEIEMREKPLNGPKSMLNFARAIEAAHGIKEKT